MNTTRFLWAWILLAAGLAVLGAPREPAGTEEKTVRVAGSIDGFVEYLPGDLPLIISVPHGGQLQSSGIPDRARGEFTSDANTEELARALRQVFGERLGRQPHIIICRIERKKVDCNRPIEEGAGGNPLGQKVWRQFQDHIETARAAVSARYGQGLYIDLHGQSHPIKRVELGYCLSHEDLTNSNAVLDKDPGFAEASSISSLAKRSSIPFSDLLRGANSLGAMLAARGYPAVPSPDMPDPGEGNSFFDGGYNVRRHGSAAAGSIDGVQVEVNFAGIRDTALNRKNFSLAFLDVLQHYFAKHYGMDLRNREGEKVRDVAGSN